MGKLFIFGLGYTGLRLAAAARARGWWVRATGRAGDMAFDHTAAVHEALAQATHVLSSIPPQADGDPVLKRYGDRLEPIWCGYLSSTGVYGDTGGAWVDESASTGRGRRSARTHADAAWLARGAHVFRLPGIYGPGRNVFDRLAVGKAHRIDAPEQIFSRVHVEDIVAGLFAAMESDAPPGAYNLADDLPAGNNAVIEHACRLSGRDMPPLLPLDEAPLSPAARGFYTENRRIANGKAKRLLGWRPRYPDYSSGLAAILAAEGTEGS